MNYLLPLALTLFFTAFPALLTAETHSDGLTIYYNNDVRGETEPCG